MGSIVKKEDYRYPYRQKREKENKVKYFKVLCTIICVIALVSGILYQKGIIVIPTGNNRQNTGEERTTEDTQEDFSRFIQQVFVDEVTDNSITLNYTLKNKSPYEIEETEA